LRSSGRQRLSVDGSSVSDYSGSGSDRPSVGTCICSVCVDRPSVLYNLMVLLLLSAIVNVAPEPGTLSLPLRLHACY